jgi:hypothetical protein
MNPDVLARGLGWFSFGLGFLELAFPDQLAETLGMEGREDLIRFYGAREVAAGAGCLMASPPTTYVWGRVAGDALDIATLAAYLGPDNPKRGNVGVAMAAVLGVTVLDVLCGVWLTEGRDGTINRRVRSRIEQKERDNERRMRQTAYANA